MRLSVIIVSYNTRDLLRRCLESVDPENEIIVVDNASADGSPEMVAADFPDVKLIANPDNRGFGAANNQGFDAMTGGLALLLNSDAFATPGAVDRMVNVMDDPSVVACGGRLVDPSVTPFSTYEGFVARLTEGRGLIGTGESLRRRWKDALDSSTQNSCCNELTLWAVFCEQTFLEKIFPNSTFFAPYWLTKRILRNCSTPNTQNPTPVTQVMGACLMMRPVERFDERFFLYCEDTELCYRLQKHGEIDYVPDAVFGHELGASSAATRWESVARYNHGKELYFRIHHGRFASAVCLVLDRAGALLRLCGWTIATILTLGSKRSIRAKVALFAKVFCVNPRAGLLQGRPVKKVP